MRLSELLKAWYNGERLYRKGEVEELVKRIKLFNAGVIDKSLDSYADKQLSQWVDDMRKS